MAAIGNVLYLSAGKPYTNAVPIYANAYADLWAFNITTSSWAQLAPAPTAVLRHSLSAVGTLGASPALVMVAALTTPTVKLYVFTPGPLWFSPGTWAQVDTNNTAAATDTYDAAVTVLQRSPTLSEIYSFGGFSSGSGSVVNAMRRILVNTAPASPTLTWGLLTMGGTAPSVRQGAAIAVVGAAAINQSMLVLFGGIDSAGNPPLNDAFFVTAAAATGAPAADTGAYYAVSLTAGSAIPSGVAYAAAGVAANGIDFLALPNNTAALTLSSVYRVTAVSSPLFSAAGGQTLTVTGTPLAASPGSISGVTLTHSVTAVTYACPLAAAPSVATSVACIIPAGLPVTYGVAGAPTYSVQVTVSSGLPPQSLRSISIVPVPATVSVADAATSDYAVAVGAAAAITITAGGTPAYLASSLSDVVSVLVGGAACTGVAWNSDSSLSCTAPALAAGRHWVNVTTVSGGAAPAAVLYAIPAPAVTALTTVSGQLAGGQQITFTGTWLGGAAVSLGSLPGGSASDTVDNSVLSVAINSAACAVVSQAPGAVTCTTSAFPSAGLFPIVVRTRQGGTASSSSLFSVIAPPSISLISPSRAAAGSVVTITGTSLGADVADVANITIGGAQCVLVSAAGAPITTITCTLGTPATVGAYPVVVRTTSGGTGTSSALFTYSEVDSGAITRTTSKKSTLATGSLYFWLIIAAACLCCVLLLLLLLLLCCLRRKREVSKEPTFVDPLVTGSRAAPPSDSSSLYEYEYSEPAQPKAKVIKKRRIRRRTVEFDRVMDRAGGPQDTETSALSSEFLSDDGTDGGLCMGD